MLVALLFEGARSGIVASLLATGGGAVAGFAARISVWLADTIAGRWQSEASYAALTRPPCRQLIREAR